MDNKPSMIKSTAIGGLAAAILSSIPIVNCLNVACCSLLIGGGMLAAFLYSREVETAGGVFSVGPGAVVGALTAVWYTIGTALAGLLRSMIIDVSIAEQFELAREQMEQNGNIPPEGLEMLDKISEFLANSGGAVLMALGLVFALALGLVFCTVGGLIGGAVFKKDGAPTPPAATM